jgi:hypothetical protein
MVYGGVSRIIDTLARKGIIAKETSIFGKGTLRQGMQQL